MELASHRDPSPTQSTDVSRIENNLCRLETRVRGLEAAYKRTPISAYNPSPNLFQRTLTMKTTSSQAFTDYLRLGDSGSYKSLTSADPRTGAVFLPSPSQDFVEQRVPDYSPLRKLARTLQVTTDALELLIDKGAGDVGWTNEAGARDETRAPELTKLRIHTHEMYARPRASQKLLDDIKVDLEQWLTTKIAWQMGVMENQAFIKGNGEGKPKGFLTYPLVDAGSGDWGKIESVKTGKDAGITDGDCLVELFHILKPEYLDGAVWMMPRAALSLIRKLKDKQGGYIYSESLVANQSGSLLGHPIVISDAMPALAKGSPSVVFANFQHGYQIVERQDIQVLRDPYSAKPYIEFYATKRVGGDVVNFDAIKALRFE